MTHKILAAVLAALTALTVLAIPAVSASAASSVVTLQGNWRGQGVEAATYNRSTAVFTGAGMSFRYGRPGDVPLAGDWDGDGLTELGINRGKWMHLKTVLGPGTGDISYWYGWETDTPVVGDWNRDGIHTISVRRGADLYVKNSHTGGPADHVWPAQAHDTARNVMDSLGCRDVVLTFGDTSPWGGLAHLGETPGRVELPVHVPLSDVANRASHECAHFTVFRAFGGDFDLMYSRLMEATGRNSGWTATEEVTDCISVRRGYWPGWLMSNDYCTQPHIVDAVDAILAGRMP